MPGKHDPSPSSTYHQAPRLKTNCGIPCLPQTDLRNDPEIKVRAQDQARQLDKSTSATTASVKTDETTTPTNQSARHPTDTDTVIRSGARTHRVETPMQRYGGSGTFAPSILQTIFNAYRNLFPDSDAHTEYSFAPRFGSRRPPARSLIDDDRTYPTGSRVQHRIPGIRL